VKGNALDSFLTVADGFDSLTSILESLKEAHASDPAALARLEAAQKHARRGAELARSCCHRGDSGQ